jgi:hypothetical protein
MHVYLHIVQIDAIGLKRQVVAVRLNSTVHASILSDIKRAEKQKEEQQK